MRRHSPVYSVRCRRWWPADGDVVAFGENTEWFYTADDNTITFVDYVPGLGSEVVLTYDKL